MNKCLNVLLMISMLSFLNITYAEKKLLNCNLINVNESLQCVLKENKNLLYQLDGLNNKKKDDYRNWKSRIKNNCENKIRYSMGEGTALEKEQCLRDEYIIRIKNISVNFHKNNNIEKNDDGFPVTSLPYNSEDHLKCILENNKNSCSKVKLINIIELSKVYNFLDDSFGASVVLPKSNNGLLIIVSLFSEESGEKFINLALVNSLGVVKNITLNASKNIIIINNNHEVFFYKENNKSKVLLK
ncbi:hypothetical protein E2K73_13825 [Acinetobacter sp. RF15A]|uniref:hypothetical protein n=1 Tax=unclassified Acinetobacter TaxID=196816 RepID=UPI001196EE9A|nr:MULTISPECIES: hypothetical protein [unclassified Acinetobacter]TSH68325.1 hypothetical protein E2K73_13825 [Acinetobacter sp. RF15A]TSI16280.1 hypothetical protein E2K74_10915 [Acinetobacter sp. RF15B]